MAVAEHKTPDLARLYRHQARDMPVFWTFRIDRIRPGVRRNLDLTAHVDSVDWGDDGLYGSGSLTLIKPDPNRQWQPLTKADRVRVSAFYRGHWFQMVTMRVEALPESDTGAGILSYALKDDLALLTVQKRDWRFRKTRQRGRGWYPGEIARAVAKREGLRVGTIHRGEHRIDKLEKKDSYGLDAIFEAYNQEREKTGSRYYVRIHNGKLEISKWRRNVYLLVLNQSIEESSITRTPAKANPATVWTGKGRVGKGTAARKVRYRYKRDAAVRKFGMREKEKDYGRVASEAALRKKVKADYADEIKVHKGGSLTLTGIPFLRGAWGSMRKGEGIRVILRPEGFTGKASWFWTKAVRHSVSGGEYTMTVDFDDGDPWLAYEEEKDKAARERKRKQRKGKS